MEPKWRKNECFMTSYKNVIAKPVTRDKPAYAT